MRTEDEIRVGAADERPFSNASEHDLWADRYCYNDCVHDDLATEKYCPIITVALTGKDGRSTAWPAEWTRKYLKFGGPVADTDRREVIETTADDPDGCVYVDACTEYEERRDPGPGDDPAEPDPPPVCDGQLDIVDAYLPTALAELTPAAAPAGQVTR